MSDWLEYAERVESEWIQIKTAELREKVDRIAALEAENAELRKALVSQDELEDEMRVLENEKRALTETIEKWCMTTQEGAPGQMPKGELNA